MKKIIIIIVIIALIMFLSILYIVKNNNNYQNNIIKEVENNYQQKISYANKYGNKYIVKTDEKIVVLDDKYEEIESIKLSEVKELEYELVYRKNEIMYQKSEVKGNKIIYTYYDLKNNEEIDKVEIEG